VSDERVEELPIEIRTGFRDAVQTLTNARRAEAWDTLFKAVRWALQQEAAAAPRRAPPEYGMAVALQAILERANMMVSWSEQDLDGWVRQLCAAYAVDFGDRPAPTVPESEK
jgi:hypothetical protein